MIYVTISRKGDPTVYYNYTSYVGEVTISDNISSLGAHLRFTVFNSVYESSNKSGVTNHFHERIPIGSWVQIVDKQKGVPSEILFIGMITSETFTIPGQYVYEAYDLGFYLNKSMINIQFNNIDARTALNQVLIKANHGEGAICDMPTKIRKIYHANTVSDVIRDIIKQAEEDQGIKYRIETRPPDSQVHIERYKDLEIKLVPKPVNNADRMQIGMNPIEFEHSQNMDDLKTMVTIVSGNEKYSKLEYLDADFDAIAKYGLINEVINVDTKNRSQAKSIAEKRLKEVSSLRPKLRLKLFGDKRVRSGRILNFEKSIDVPISIVGKFLVTSCVHTYNNQFYHIMDLELEERFD